MPNLIENIAGILFIIYILLEIKENITIYNKFKEKYGKPEYWFLRACNVSENKNFKLSSVICLYSDKIVTMYNGEEIIIPKHAYIEYQRFYIGKIAAKFKIKINSDRVYDISVGYRAIKPLKQFFCIL